MEIHSFAIHGDTAKVLKELANGVPVDVRDDDDHTPLAYAVNSPNASPELVQVLVEAGANINAFVNEERKSIIGLAACSGSLEKVRVLLDAGADVNLESPKGYTPLITSCTP